MNVVSFKDYIVHRFKDLETLQNLKFWMDLELQIKCRNSKFQVDKITQSIPLVGCSACLFGLMNNNAETSHVICKLVMIDIEIEREGMCM